MRVLLCGDREWVSRTLIRDEVSKLAPSDVVIQGGAPGADRIAAEEAKKKGLKVEEYFAEWSRYGKAAGPIRNRRMLKEGKPDKVIAFHNNIERSKGTKDMLELAKENDIPFELIK